ncbi:DNA polymerase [Catenaria anguillulae PL171]|uniref:DNA polymerase n=1 Tax=Catenaria anguillulae PL171 TaxID=765915 RepID=A0A1Y2HIM0_9FUNG|nr:DNA polymerase [Catenaria anguillulae PL171]
MFQGLIALTRKWDPDALLGYELHGGSWGYLIERCHRIYGFDLTLDLARTITRRTQLDTRTLNAWGYRKGSSFSVAGRLILNVWRLLRSEINLTDYSLESTVAHVLKRRFPRFPPSLLTRWYTDPRTRHRTVQVCVRRTLACMQLMVAGSYLDRTAEFARVYGIEFMGVLTRGSQYRVEAVMMRLARRLGYILLSPTRQQVAAQRAAECTPLVMEPESALYVDPVVVLDFQSLYPSIMIAYNLCFSTCVGKLVRGGKEVAAKLGCDEAYEMPRGLARDKVTVTPNGVMFVKSSERGGLLGKLLVELLETRVMVKQSIKLYKDNKAMTRLLDFRQLSLKLLANVIYGYCAASFSGRMPMVELGDAVVQTGRETLERGIQLINSHPDWRARVVYGDTDSLFIELKGATKPHAFSIGQAISRAVSALNPQPIHLKFEKVYLPCILVTKKRYIGHKYESPDQSEPDFDAKGIETVRRDGCPATGIIMKTALEVLFVHRDVSKVKAYVTRQFSKLMEGRIPIKDLIIAKEVKLGKYSDRVLPPPGAYLSMQKMRADPRTEPQYGQRVPYIVAYGAPGDRLIDQVMCPRDVLKHAEFRVHAHYYISKQIIPALTRLFQLFGADIGEWYAEMPKVAGKVVGQAAADSVKRITLDQYYQSRHCAVCDMVVPAARVRSLQAKNGGGGSGNNSAFVLVCDTCRANPGKLARKVLGKVRAAEMRYKALAQLCTDCIELGPLGVEDIECDSLACAVLYDRVKAARARRAAMQAAVQVGVVGSSDGAETAVVEIDD